MLILEQLLGYSC